MATFTVNTASGLDMLSIDIFDLFDYANETRAATSYRVFDDAANFSRFIGTGLTYGAAPFPDTDLTGGNITSITRTVGAALQYTFGSITALTAVELQTFRDTDDSLGLIREILSGDDTIKGSAAIDVLFGVSGNDRIDGGLGADTMVGGLGNDTYVVDNVGDTIIEEQFPPVDPTATIYKGDGTDTVESSVSYAIPLGIENLTLTGVGNNNATGNFAPNVIKGNAGNNIIDGGLGADDLQGGAGNDTYFVDDQMDTVTDTAGFDVVFSAGFVHTLGAGVENGTLIGGGLQLQGNALANVLTGTDGALNQLNGGGGNDTINGLGGVDRLDGEIGNDLIDGGDGNDILIGGAGNDTIVGGDGDDFIDGNPFAFDLAWAAGADKMSGGLGNDFYLVDNIGDLVTEGANAGTDRVNSLISYVLTANVEELRLIAPGNFNATGNAIANKLFGNDGNNVLDGKAAADIMQGFAGNDTYLVDNAGDRVLEAAVGGDDLVKSSISYRLAANVEKLELTGVANLDGTGNALANTITGNAGNNILNGLAGEDIMLGGAGNDIFIVDNSLDVATDTSGVDLVRSTAAYGLGAGIENLELLGSATIFGIGNILNNKITGNGAENLIDGAAGNDTIIGGGGNDLLGGGIGNDVIDGGIGDDIINAGAGSDTITGGAGNDRFVYESLSPAFDTITEFKHLEDDLVISIAAFGGGLTAGGTVLVTTGPGAVGFGVAQMVYNNVSGALIWDTNGQTAGGATQFAKLSAGLTITTADFVFF